ncbi:protein FAM49A [Pundamilia nyererei]|uniref:Protein FAM49A n=1 Tax=Pundamilia nyererei TaxID=303518 RepID=A0A9Y3VBC7_9CICH|nr:PREDICTED: protein FAM49A-like [Pundamilia nyererei]
MGNLLKVLTREIENYPHFFLDFENAQPTDGEREVWNQVNSVLQESESILGGLQSYKGAGQEIRDVRRSAETRHVTELTADPQRLQKLVTKQLTMRNPAIQNDFSYYRRTISRNQINNMNLDIENEVNNEMANRMSLFYAEATPMLKTLSNATTSFVTENKTLPLENTTDCLSTMASVCKVMLETPEYSSRFSSEDTLLFCMRVMVGVIILYDHVHPNGAFNKSSKIDMKGCIKVLKDQPADNVEGLLNALKFTTKHLNDETTPKNIRTMLQ